MTYQETLELQNRKLKLYEELMYAINQMSSAELKAWGAFSAKLFGNALLRRIKNFGGMVSSLTIFVGKEIAGATKAFKLGNLKGHFLARGQSASLAIKDITTSAQEVFEVVGERLRSNPKEYAPILLASVIGFYAGSGGDGDGGIPDIDLVAGIGAHRSIFTHSIIAGAFVETAIFSLIALSYTVHRYLPYDHDPFWDKLAKCQLQLGSSFVQGASLGIAAHLAIDSTINGFTPYKDIPIHMPQEIHQAFMGLNSVVEGNDAFGRK